MSDLIAVRVALNLIRVLHNSIKLHLYICTRIHNKLSIKLHLYIRTRI